MREGFPLAGPEQHAVMAAELATGIALDAHGRPSVTGPHYDIFATRADAEAFVARRLADDPTIEWCVFNTMGAPVAVFSTRGTEYIRPSRG